VKLSKSTQHIIDVTVVNMVSLLEIELKLVDGRIFGRIPHDFKNFIHVVLVFLLPHEVYMAMRIIKEDKLIALVYIHRHIRLNELQFQLRAALDAFCVQVGSVVSFETIGVHLDVYLLLLSLRNQDIS
jgi:hypothetical protein